MFENTYFEYCIDPNVDEPIMLILNQIGNTHDEWGNIIEWGVQGAAFCRELLLLDNAGKSRIQIWINSIGGSVIDGYSILGGMLKTKTKIDTYNIGVAASTAGWLFEAGRNRDMSDYATWMGHNPSSSDGSDSEILKRFRDSIIKIIAGRTGTDEAEVSAMLDKETYMNATECMASGFCDSITSTSKQNVKRMLQRVDISDKYKEALLIANISLPTKIKEPVMADVNKLDVNITNKLELVAEASPAMVVRAIDEIQNALVIANGKATEKEKALTIANKAKDDLQAKYDDLCKDMKALKDAMEAEEAENLVKDATEMVNGFAKAGKIENKPEIIADWIADASVSKEALTKVTNRIAALPVNKEANKIDVVATLTGLGTGGPKNLAQRMLDIQKKHLQK